MAIIMHRDFLKINEKYMKVDSYNSNKRTSSRVSPSLNYLLRQPVPKCTKKLRCVQTCTFICDFTCVLWGITQTVRWLCWAQFFWELHVPLHPAGSVASSLSRAVTSYTSMRFCYFAGNQLVGCKSEQFKGLLGFVGITLIQQHAIMQSPTSGFACHLCKFCAFSRCHSATSWCSEEGIYQSTSAYCTVRPEISLVVYFSIPHCNSVFSSCFLLPNIDCVEDKRYMTLTKAASFS